MASSTLTVTPSTVGRNQNAPPGWQHAISSRLLQRDSNEHSFQEIIQQYRRLSQHTLLLKDRNLSLLRAASGSPTGRGSDRGGTSLGSAVGGGGGGTGGSGGVDGGGGGSGGGGGGDDSIRLAYINSLESQLTSVREELSNLYKTQSQNAQRLLVMNETLREREDQSRIESAELTSLRTSLNSLQSSNQTLQQTIKEKESFIQRQSDELVTANLELESCLKKNEDLKDDNATLLRRWLERMNDEVGKMNEAFNEEAASLARKEKEKTPTPEDPQEEPSAGSGAVEGGES